LIGEHRSRLSPLQPGGDFLSDSRMGSALEAIDYAKKLISFDSVSSVSNTPVTDWVDETLSALGFETERVEYTDPDGVAKSNVIGKKGSGTGGIAYFGHTDVVPADNWESDAHGPFEPTVSGDRLYGRGSCDMKGSVACMLAAAGRCSAAELAHPIYITCTADEEVGYGGAAEVAKRSRYYREMVAGESHGIVGEPTRLEVVYGHKGTYGFQAVSRGRAAHSSTREGINANLAMIPFLSEMKAIHDEVERDEVWHNAEFDPPTVSWNIGINDHTRAVNITAPQSICTVYFRPTPGIDADALLARAALAAERCGIEFEALRMATPFYLDRKSPYVEETLAIADRETAGTVSYGTDACMFGEMKHLVVLGPGDIAQAHTADEWIELEQFDLGTELYAKLVRHWCLNLG
jgi:acetylornithine deacetylase